MRLPKNRPPTHPGEHLSAFLDEYSLSQSELARRVGISFVRVNEIIRGKRGVTPDSALRFARLFGTTPELWLNLQLAYDMWHVARNTKDLERIEPITL
jgi:antitoxin HigA-1